MLEDKLEDWPWRFKAKFHKAHNSDTVELIVSLGFRQHIHIRFSLDGINHFSWSAKNKHERLLAHICSDFITKELLSAPTIIVDSIKQTDTFDYMGNIMYNRIEDESIWLSLSNEIILSGIMEAKGR